MFTEQRTPHVKNQNKMLSLVNRDTVKDLKIPGFEHQTTQFIERSAMTSKPSTFRIIPGYDSNGKILSTLKEGYDRELLGKDPASCLSGTFCSVSAIQPFGNQWRDKVLTAYPPGSADDEERINLGKMSVLEKFSRVVNFCTDTQKKGRRPMQAHPDWFRWTSLKGSLGKVKWRFMFQAIIFQDSGRYFTSKNEETQQDEYRNMVGLISIDQQASINEFMSGIATPAMMSKPVDVFTNSNLGPVAELDGIWCYAHPEEAYGNENIKWKLVPKPYPQGSPVDTPPTPYPLSEDWVRAAWQPWTKLLKWYTKEEQFYLIAEIFGPDTVNYFFEALGDDFYTSFIPMDIRQKGYGRYANMLQPTGGISMTGGYGAVPQIQPAIPSTSMMNSIPKVATTHQAPTAPVMPPSPSVPDDPEPVHAPVPQAVMPAPVIAAPAMPKAPMPGIPAPTTGLPGMREAQEDDRIGHMPKAAPNLPPQVEEMMRQAMVAGVKVSNPPPVIQNLGLPKVPTIDLDDIVATNED